MSGNTSLGGIIAQGVKVEKLQEIQQQTPEGQRQRALSAAEEDKRRQQKQVRKSQKGEKDSAVSEREARGHYRETSDSEAKKRSGEILAEEAGAPKKSGDRIIDIVV